MILFHRLALLKPELGRCYITNATKNCGNFFSAFVKKCNIANFKHSWIFPAVLNTVMNGLINWTKGITPDLSLSDESAVLMRRRFFFPFFFFFFVFPSESDSEELSEGLRPRFFFFFLSSELESSEDSSVEDSSDSLLLLPSTFFPFFFPFTFLEHSQQVKVMENLWIK